MNTIRAFLIAIVLPGIMLPLSVFAQQRSVNSTQNSRWHKAVIAIVLNESKKNIQISHASIKEIVRPGKSLVKQRFVVPFASIKLYMREILNGKAYVPREALRITTQAGRFGLWEDERGIQGCKLERDLFGEEIVESLLTKDRLHFELMLTLKIDVDGALVLNSD